MLSISKISNSKSATSYYEKDDYYAKDDPKHQQQSSWTGKGAEKLGLHGEVLKEDFKKILDGNLPNGQSLGKIRDGEMVHDSGRDLTFSAPKSVSIMALVYRDERLINAHSKAVDKTLDIVEQQFLKTRSVSDKEVVIEPVKNMVAATFRHFVSREQDPQLHTHAVIANISVQKEGYSKCAFFDEIYDNKKLIGAIYRSELAKSAKELGYEIESKGKDSLFELKNVPKDLMEQFSTRSKKIREKAGEDASQRKLEQTTLRTRARKKENQNLQKIWNEKLKENLDLGNQRKIEIPEERNQKEQENNHTFVKERFQVAKEAVLYAIDHLAERKTVFTSNEIAYEALNDKLSKVTINDIYRAVNKLAERRDHLLYTKRSDLAKHYTTKKALQNENYIISLTKAGQNKFTPIINKSDISKHENLTKNLNSGQKKAANLILTTKDQFVGIQGYAGTGKTFMLKSVNQIAKKQGKELIGLAPIGVATNNLESESGIKSMTLQRFLKQYDGVANGRGTKEGRIIMQDLYKNKVFIVDESSALSTIQMKYLLTIAKELKFKVVFIGDIKQLDSVEAGVPFHEMQKNGMKTTEMREIIRQKEDDLRQAVYNTIDNNIRSSFDKLDVNVNEVKEEKIISTTINEFLKLSPKEKSNTLILTPANETRQRVNEIISRELIHNRKNSKELQSNDLKHNILISKNLTESQKLKAYSYEVGNILLFNKKRDGLNIKKNQYCQVVRVDSKNNKIIVVNNKNEEILFNPANLRGKSKEVGYEVFSSQERIFRIGDKVAFNKGINNLRIRNSEQATIEEIKSDKIKLSLDSKDKQRTLTLKTTSDAIKHIDYSYAITAHKAQGLTCDRVIAIVESYRKNLTTQKNFYVSISRARYKATIITDHKENAVKQLEKNTGIEVSAREHQRIKSSNENVRIQNNLQKEFG